MSILAKLTEDINVGKFTEMWDQLENQAERLAKLMDINKKIIENTLEFNAINNSANNVDYSWKAKEEIWNTINNEVYKPKEVINKIEDKVETENKIKELIYKDEQYTPTKTQKNQADKIISKVKKDEPIIEKTIWWVQIDLNKITSESKSSKVDSSSDKTIKTDTTSWISIWWVQIDLNKITSEKKSDEGNIVQDSIEQKETNKEVEIKNEELTTEKVTTEEVKKADWWIMIDINSLTSSKSDNDNKKEVASKTAEEIEAEKLLSQAANSEDSDDENSNKIDLSKIM